MMIFFRTRMGKILIWQNFSETGESDFNGKLCSVQNSLAELLIDPNSMHKNT